MDSYLIFIDDLSINTETLEEVESKIGNNKSNRLFLILQSYGGDPFSAVAVMNVLQSHFTKISVIIPCYAKSAGTLMALGTDEIYMGERSALGPLDLPIEHHRDGSRISALDVQNTITTMAGLINTIAEDRYKFLRDEKKDRRISKKEAAQFSLENATDFLKPIIQQIDPYHLQKAYRELRIGYWYAIDMLSSRMMRNDSDLVAETAKRLVQDFPAHEYSIFRNDAEKMLNLNVKDLRDLKEWEDDLKSKYDKVRKKKYHIEYGNIISNDKISNASKQSKQKTPNGKR